MRFFTLIFTNNKISKFINPVRVIRTVHNCFVSEITSVFEYRDEWLAK